MTDIPAPAHIRAIAPYQAGKPIEELAREYGLDPEGIIKLASNENPLGCSDRVRAALACSQRWDRSATIFPASAIWSVMGLHPCTPTQPYLRKRQCPRVSMWQHSKPSRQ